MMRLIARFFMEPRSNTALRTVNRPLKHLLCIVHLIAPLTVAAQDLAGLAADASRDLEKASAELTALREQIGAERIPLSRRLTELESKLAERKAQLAAADRTQANELLEKNALEKEAGARADEVKAVDAFLSEYAKAFRARLAFIEEPRYRQAFEAFEKAGTDADAPPADKFTRRSEFLLTALKRAEAALGGELFDGKALDKQGLVQPGKVALIGPVAVFASASGGSAGVLQQELNKADPSVVELDAKIQEAGRQLVAGGKGQLALDPTLGNAFKLAALQESLFEKLEKGGLVMIPLLGLGAAALLVALMKWLQFSRVRLVSERDLQKVLRHLENSEQEKALSHARSIPGMAGDLLTTAVEHAEEKKEYIEEIVYEKMLGARTRLERGIAFLALTATTGPLMGLLGTVMGMIATFKLISSFGSGDPKLLAAGISEALIATATGMAVAIPALLLHAFLSRKAKGIIGSMEQTAVGFINGVPDPGKPGFV